MLDHGFCGAGKPILRLTFEKRRLYSAYLLCGRYVVAAFLCWTFVARAAPALAANPAADEAVWARLNISLEALTSWISKEFSQTPAIVLGVAIALAVPLLAVLGLLLRARSSPAATAAENDPRSIPISGWNARGLLIVANSGGEVHEIGHGLVRIGREEDNDVQLVHKTVHRYHAVVERTVDAEFYLTDVSGAGGNGVRVDGDRIERARLRGGELIEIGKTRLRFQLAEASE